MVTTGQKIDLQFPVHAVRDGMSKEVAFADLLNRRTVISVYMKNNTGACDRQIDSLAKQAMEIDRQGYDLIALSRDTPGSQLRYAAKKQLRFTLLSDPSDLFACATQSLVQKSMYGRTFIGPSRAAYLLAPDGVVHAIVRTVYPNNHAAQVLDMIRGTR